MHGLVVPLALPRLHVEGDDAVCEEGVARPMAPVVIAGGHFRGHEDQSQLRIRAHLGPCAGVAVVLGRPLEPRVVAELALPRDRVEDPQTPPGADVVAAYEPLRILHRPWRGARPVRGTNDDDVADDERGGVQADLARIEIEVLVVFELQIDRAAAPERRDRSAGLGVERQQPVAGRHVDDSPIGAVSAGPIRQAAAGAVANGVVAAAAFVLGVHPEHLAGGGVERDRRSPRARRRVQDAAHHQRRRGVQRVGRRSQKVRLEPPGDLQPVEVVLRDLIRGRVAMAGEIGAVREPFERRPVRRR